ncbi:hypothetical protein EDD18DRAFT_1357494 [Armillaria luteobubalina]|uniref:Uncharacterized protein n=1 Tax=Armillaria luteobubalina TaxID=153913 RepID=A0AA39PXZ7_9AGAR|nr:hypothetical protein EDD18DRAFT_1357494 [Armillaria luteobubalina]
MATEKEINFTLSNSRLNTDPRFELPIGWSCNWRRFYGSDCLSPCVKGRIYPHTILEGAYNLERGEIFFVMYKKRTHLTIISLKNDPIQYYLFDIESMDKLIKFMERYQTLDHFMEKARLWFSDDAQINSVTPYQVMSHDPNSRDLNELYDEWDEYMLCLE